MNIRGHHLFCILGFRGIGYNSNFNKNISKVKKYLTGNPEEEFKVIVGEDVICKQCPHLINGHCRKNETNSNVNNLDIKVLKTINVKPESYLSIEILKKRILQAQINLENICSGCQWFKLGFCEEAIKDLAEDMT